MIEILKEETLEARGKRETTENKKNAGEKKQDIPKNIRQVGEGGENIKVYFEDYVMTYIKQLAALGKERYEVLVLYGDKRKMYGKTYYFISGSVKVENEKSCLDDIFFQQEDWKKINETADNFFSGISVLGWALLCEDEDLELNQRILETQETFFRQEQSVFLQYTKLEKEEKVFLYQRGEMQLQPGHFIFYDKNEKMQNYMIQEKEKVEKEEKVEEESIDHAARQFRKVVQEKQEHKRKRHINALIYSTAVVLALVVILIGFTLLSNYEKMDNMEKVLYQMADHTDEAGDQLTNMEEKLEAMEVDNSIAAAELSQEQIPAGGEPVTTTAALDMVQNNNMQSTDEENITVQGKNEQNNSGQAESVEDATQVTKEENNVEKADNENGNEGESLKEGESVEATSTETNDAHKENNQIDSDITNTDKEVAKTEETINIPEYQIYEIQKGDTLQKINQMFYGNINRIKEICELNHIENQDNICYGEKIILP